MVFKIGKPQDDEPDRSQVERARARYALRTATPGVLERVLTEVDARLSQQARAAWLQRLADEKLTGLQHVTSVVDIVDATDRGGEESRRALARSATDEVLTEVARAASVAPAFAGFATSPEAQEVGVPDPERQVTRGRRRPEPPYLPGTTAGGRR